jgi:hypothetical protein
MRLCSVVLGRIESLGFASVDFVHLIGQRIMPSGWRFGHAPSGLKTEH